MKVIVRSTVEPPASLYIGAGQMPSCPGCVGTIELYRMSDGWHADVVHEPDCSWLPAEPSRPPAAARPVRNRLTVRSVARTRHSPAQQA